MTAPLTTEQIAGLQRHDTCTVSNAIETFNVRLRNEGFADSSIRCLTLCSTPLVGYAVTLRIRCANPRMDGHPYVDRTEWWGCLEHLPAPRVVVIEDMDAKPGTGSFIGEVHAAILAALGCAGAITNGAVRDLPALTRAGFHAFGSATAVSHAYSHIVEFGQPVEIGGLTIRPGDLLHADCHGVLSVPLEVAGRVAAVADAIVEREQRILGLCRSPGFSIENLRGAVGEVFH
ncbi:MAG: hypothetical protein JWO94_3984 [Verrucomicrobiaceae bacterium]|nr:hypothetical protein [Verrucomicrobiaceae bacterium]